MFIIFVGLIYIYPLQFTLTFRRQKLLILTRRNNNIFSAGEEFYFGALKGVREKPATISLSSSQHLDVCEQLTRQGAPLQSTASPVCYKTNGFDN